MEISRRRRMLYVTSDTGIRQINLDMCAQRLVADTSTRVHSAIEQTRDRPTDRPTDGRTVTDHLTDRAG